MADLLTSECQYVRHLLPNRRINDGLFQLTRCNMPLLRISGTMCLRMQVKDK